MAVGFAEKVRAARPVVMMRVARLAKPAWAVGLALAATEFEQKALVPVLALMEAVGPGPVGAAGRHSTEPFAAGPGCGSMR